MTRSRSSAAALLLVALALPATADAQIGILNRAKKKAAERIAETVADKAAAQVTKSDSSTKGDSAAPRPAATSTRPARPTGGRARGNAPVGASEGKDSPSWHGSAPSQDEFKTSIAPLTEDALAVYMRARAAMTEEAIRLSDMFEARSRDVTQYMGTTLGTDERAPIPGWMGVWQMAGPRRVERHLEGVLDRALGGEMTRMQFYQMHEMVEIFLVGAVNQPPTSSGVMGRKLTSAELALLGRHKAGLEALRAKQKLLR